MSQAKLKELAKRYGLGQDDFWQLPQNNRVHILTHDACEKIASIEGVRYEKPEWLSKGEGGVWAVQASGYKSDDPENILWTTGEASKQNCTAKYLVNMAEKRAKDRLVLKLIKAYEYGIKSEEEADEFKKPDTEATTAGKPVGNPSTESSSNGNGEIDAESMAERRQVWSKLVDEARATFSSGNYKAEIHDKLVELYGDEGKIERLKGAYKLSEYPTSGEQAKEVLNALDVPNLNQVYQEVFPNLVETD